MIRTIQSVASYYEYREWLEFFEQQGLTFSELYEDEAQILICDSIAIVFPFVKRR